MDKKRNGLLEVYRFILCFWPLYYHNYFFFKTDSNVFSVAELAVDFFFVISGFFLVRLLQKEKDTPILKGIGKLMLGRIKPMLFTMGFIVLFNLVCIILFIRSDYLSVIFELYKYWWFVWCLAIAIGILFIVYRLLKSEKLFMAFLAVCVVAAAIMQYLVVEDYLWWRLAFVNRPLACIPIGILLSYIPKMNPRKFNISIPIVIILIPTMLYFAYNPKTYFIRMLMIAMFAVLVYFSSNIAVGGVFFDLIGKLSVRMYLYMAFITMIQYLGIDRHRELFIIDVAFASLDLAVTYYRDKYNALKKKQEKEISEPVLAEK